MWLWYQFVLMCPKLQMYLFMWEKLPRFCWEMLSPHIAVEVSHCHALTLCWCSLFIAASLKKEKKKKSTAGWARNGREGVFLYLGQHLGRVDIRSMVALLRQRGLKEERSSDWGVTDGWLFNTSTVPYGSPIRFHWKNRLRPEEQPLPQCVHTSAAPALPPWGPAAPSGPHWTCTPPNRERDCSPKGRN